MLKVLDCLTREHDPGLVVLAVVICVVASVTAFTLYAHATNARGRAHAGWLFATVLVTGGGSWATHFIAMLAYDPKVPVGFDLFETFLSVVIAIGFAGVGFTVASFAASPRSPLTWLGGAIVGLGIGAMHYTGMAALQVPATVEYDTTLVAWSVALGVFFSALAMRRFRVDGGLAACIESGLILVAGIGLLHFVGMGALSFHETPFVALAKDALSTQRVAIAVAMAVLVIAVAALLASLVDQHVAARLSAEAERLRRAIGELERTKAQLEATGANLQEALAAAAAGSHAKSQFLATMSHELRTPLNAVIGFSDAMASGVYGPLTDKQRGCADDIRSAGVHLLALVNDVLDVSCLEAGAIQLDEEDLDIGLVVGDAVKLNIGRAKENGVEIATDLPPTLPILRADARRVKQILVNLLSNAVKFTPTGGRVSISVERVRDGLCAIVRDTGIGMAPDEIPIALASFGQVDNRLARKFEGVGLGLPLSKRLAELHGGALAVESAPNVGTTVTVTFPNDRLREMSAAA